MRTLTPVLQPAEPDTPLRMPHVTWHETWRPLLRRFLQAVADGDVGEVREVNYERPSGPDVDASVADDVAADWTGEPTAPTLHLAAAGIDDPGLRRDMKQFAAAFYEYELPEDGGVVLTDMLLGFGDEMQSLFAFLRAELLELTGERLAAHFVPTVNAGMLDKSKPAPFPLHSDMWHTEMLFNVFNRVVDDGDAILLRIEDAWEVISDAGVPDEAVAAMRTELAGAATCADFSKFNGWLYLPEHPWVQGVTDALFAACTPVAMKPGQGYFVNDRQWLHGRTELTWPADMTLQARRQRLYRLGYNNRRLMNDAAAEGFDWAAAGTAAAGCMSRH